MGTYAVEVSADRGCASHLAEKRPIRTLFLLLFLTAWFLPAGRAQQASDCLTCHSSSVGLKNSQG